MSYEDRFKVLELTTLEERRKRGDLIYIHKLTKGYESIQWENMPFKPENDTRIPNVRRESSSTKRSNDFCKAVDLRHYFYSKRVAPD